jgi:hypothetical protein
MPFDFVKTQLQKDKNMQEKSSKILKFYYKQYGIRSLYIGWQFKSLQYFLQSVFTVKTLDYLENKAKSLK